MKISQNIALYMEWFVAYLDRIVLGLISDEIALLLFVLAEDLLVTVILLQSNTVSESRSFSIFM